MLIVKVSFRGVKLDEAGINPHAAADFFVRGFRSNVRSDLWQTEPSTHYRPFWSARDVREKEAFERFGLKPDERIPVPRALLSSGGWTAIVFAFRQDLADSLGNARIEQTLSCMAEVLLESLSAAGQGKASFDIAFFPFEHLLLNERTYYFVPKMWLPGFDGRKEALERHVMRQIGMALANTCYGAKDRIDRLTELAFAAEELAIERIGGVRSGASGSTVDHVEFSAWGRFTAPFFMPWDRSVETGSLARLNLYQQAA